MHGHDIKVEGVTYTCNVNGDFSGDVILSAEAGVLKYEEGHFAKAHWEEVRIPFEVFQELVGRYMETEIVSKLESMSGKDIVKWAKGVV